VINGLIWASAGCQAPDDKKKILPVRYERRGVRKYVNKMNVRMFIYFFTDVPIGTIGREGWHYIGYFVAARYSIRALASLPFGILKATPKN